MPARALIVDDEPDLELLIRQKFRRKIREGEYEFVFARNGQEALNKLKEDPTLDIVLSDIKMPVMDGLTFLSSLGEVNRPIKTVMVSAYGDMQNIRAAMNRGAYDFLTKPIDFNDFEQTLNRAIQEHQIASAGLQAREPQVSARSDRDLESIPFDLRDVVARAIAVVEVRVAVKGLYVRQSIAPDVPARLMGDPDRLRQILIVLLGNSVKFTERGGLELRVGLDPEDPAPGRLRFEVADTGTGIPVDKGDRIFESFSHVDRSIRPKYGVKSEPGAGNTFFFTAAFGVAASPTGGATELEMPPAAGDLESLVAGIRILLLGASEGNRSLILSYLKDTRSTIHVVEDDADAIALFDPGYYDLVLVDIETHAVDGFATTGEIRRIEHISGFATTPVLGMAAEPFGALVESALTAGFTAVLTKPIRKNTLLEALATHAPMPRRTNWL